MTYQLVAMPRLHIQLGSFVRYGRSTYILINVNKTISEYVRKHIGVRAHPKVMRTAVISM
jgi:hypothetical protein